MTGEPERIITAEIETPRNRLPRTRRREGEIERAGGLCEGWEVRHVDAEVERAGRDRAVVCEEGRVAETGVGEEGGGEEDGCEVVGDADQGPAGAGCVVDEVGAAGETHGGAPAFLGAGGDLLGVLPVGGPGWEGVLVL